MVNNGDEFIKSNTKEFVEYLTKTSWTFPRNTDGEVIFQKNGRGELATEEEQKHGNDKVRELTDKRKGVCAICVLIIDMNQGYVHKLAFEGNPKKHGELKFKCFECKGYGEFEGIFKGFHTKVGDI